jgi:hypothetical protein
MGMLEAGQLMSDAYSTAEAGPEPTLTLKLSDGNKFYCSACHDCIASIGNGRFIMEVFENWSRCSATTSSDSTAA